jgi:predicted TIM-barrel fold metal-dependent hydrolase
MKFFDSLTHVTADGSWFGERQLDASLPTLLSQMDGAGAYRALLVAIAGYQDNAYTLASAQAHPGRLVPIAGLNPAVAATTRRVQVMVRRIREQGFAGIKLHPRLNGYDPMDAKCVAAIEAAGEEGLVILLDTLFRRPGLATRHAPDVIDHLSAACPDTKMLLLHGTGPTMMELYEIVRCRDGLLLDLSYTLLRYRGSKRLDEDMHFLMKSTDQLVTVGSDFPEYTLAETVARVRELTEGIEAHRVENITHRNLERLFAPWIMAHGPG